SSREGHDDGRARPEHAAHLAQEEDGVDHVLNRDRAHRAVELRVAERESWITIHVVNDVAPELWVVRHLLRVQTQSHDGARAEAGREMTAPTAHQIEEAATGRQNLGVQLPERGDRAVVDVDDLARNDVEAIVRRLVVPRERQGQEQAVPGGSVHASYDAPHDPAGLPTRSAPPKLRAPLA